MGQLADLNQNPRVLEPPYGAEMGTDRPVLDAGALRVGAASKRDNAMLDEALARLELAHWVGPL